MLYICIAILLFIVLPTIGMDNSRVPSLQVLACEKTMYNNPDALAKFTVLEKNKQKKILNKIVLIVNTTELSPDKAFLFLLPNKSLLLDKKNAKVLCRLAKLYNNNQLVIDQTKNANEIIARRSSINNSIDIKTDFYREIALLPAEIRSSFGNKQINVYRTTTGQFLHVISYTLSRALIGAGIGGLAGLTKAEEALLNIAISESKVSNNVLDYITQEITSSLNPERLNAPIMCQKYISNFDLVRNDNFDNIQTSFAEQVTSCIEKNTNTIAYSIGENTNQLVNNHMTSLIEHAKNMALIGGGIGLICGTVEGIYSMHKPIQITTVKDIGKPNDQVFFSPKEKAIHILTYTLQGATIGALTGSAVAISQHTPLNQIFSDVAIQGTTNALLSANTYKQIEKITKEITPTEKYDTLEKKALVDFIFYQASPADITTNMQEFPTLQQMISVQMESDLKEQAFQYTNAIRTQINDTTEYNLQKMASQIYNDTLYGAKIGAVTGGITGFMYAINTMHPTKNQNHINLSIKNNYSALE